MRTNVFANHSVRSHEIQIRARSVLLVLSTRCTMHPMSTLRFVLLC
jgi:hypothetical protein